MSVTIERHRRGVRDAGNQRLARAVGPHDINRDGSLLAARPAERDVQVSFAIEGGTVDLVEAGRKRRSDLHADGFTGSRNHAERQFFHRRALQVPWL